jgi:hypothetical protein
MKNVSRAFWLESRGVGKIREESLAPPQDGWCRIAAEFSGLSPGTERLVASGRVPPEAMPAMRCQYMDGDFTFPIKYGYSLVGRCVEGPSALVGRLVHTMHPHQDLCNVEVHAVFPIPADVPARRATLASNLETAVTALWDSEARAGERAVVLGFGIVGSLVGRLFRDIPGTDLLIVDAAAEKRHMATELGFRSADLAEAGAFDLAFECSGSPQGLQAALDAVGDHGRVIALSWYGDRDVVLRLGADFHYGRKRIISSQVATLPAAMLPRWNSRRRKELVFRMLHSPEYDRHITHVVAFEGLPSFFENLCEGRYAGLSAAVHFSNTREH